VTQSPILKEAGNPVMVPVLPWPPVTEIVAEASFLRVEATAAVVRYLRHHAESCARAWGIADDVVRTLMQVVSELAGNAVLHGSPQPEYARWSLEVPTVALSLQITTHGLSVQVFDSNNSEPHVGENERLAEDGRGMFLVEALAEDWGTLLLPTGGKVVWCRLKL
jgi:anti-sigma regulatory factor (Ser/Thr protein kinase)